MPTDVSAELAAFIVFSLEDEAKSFPKRRYSYTFLHDTSWKIGIFRDLNLACETSLNFKAL
jgi:hypothetical protein